MESPPIKRALISVSDKQGLADFARGLTAAGVEIYSTGGTRKKLEADLLQALDAEDYERAAHIRDELGGLSQDDDSGS